MLDSPSHSDGELLRLSLKGDEDAFRALYHRHQRAIYRFALQMSGKPEIAEEVTQEVFLVLMRAAQDYDPARGSLSSYLYGIARNFVLRCLEREKPYLTVLDDPGSDWSNRVTTPGDFDGELTRIERVDALRRAVLALPPAYREVVVLCDLNEMDYADAAATLACAIGTVRSRLHRGRALLVEKMRALERCAV